MDPLCINDESLLGLVSKNSYFMGEEMSVVGTEIRINQKTL